MNKLNVKSLLAKKGWTGEEVGKALIASLLNDIRHQGEEYSQLFSQADFDRMESSLNTDRDFLAYGVYRDIYSSIVDTYNRGQGLYQQFYNGYYRCLMHLHGAVQADHALRDVESYPLIVTQAQYDKARQEAQGERASIQNSYHRLMFSILESCLVFMSDGKKEKIPAAILKALEAAEKEQVTNQRILSTYNEDMGLGYYLLPDGRRSDQLSNSEWEEALLEYTTSTRGEPSTDIAADFSEARFGMYAVDRKLKGCEFFFNGADAIREEYFRLTGKDFPDASDEEVLRAFERVSFNGESADTWTDKCAQIVFTGASNALEWHYYTDLPELSKYDILDELLERYDGTYTDIPEKDQFKEFKKDYPALYEALESYIKENVPQAGSLKPSQYYKDFISFAELEKLNIVGFEGITTPGADEVAEILAGSETIKYADKKRALNSGVAIIQDPAAGRVDGDGNYKETRNPIDNLGSIDALADSQNMRNELHALSEVLFKPALRFLYAFNSLMGIIGEAYDISGIEDAKFDTSDFERQLDAYNYTLYSFYAYTYGDEEEKDRKRGLIKELFSPVFPDELKPTAEAEKAVKSEIAKLGISSKARAKLKDFHELISELEEGGSYGR